MRVFFLGQFLSKKVRLVIGVDLSFKALKIAEKMLKKKSINNYLLIQGDILKMPIKKNAIDFIYGGGIIEHFSNTKQSIEEFFRVLKKGGLSFNTVPYFNIGALTYRQKWGNIPNFPVIKQIAEFVHKKLLKGKHMKYGYEMSFLGKTLENIHKKVGFKKVKVEKFDTKLEFEGLPQYLRNIFCWLANNCIFFWPFIKVSAIK